MAIFTLTRVIVSGSDSSHEDTAARTSSSCVYSSCVSTTCAMTRCGSTSVLRNASAPSWSRSATVSAIACRIIVRAVPSNSHSLGRHAACPHTTGRKRRFPVVSVRNAPSFVVPMKMHVRGKSSAYSR